MPSLARSRELLGRPDLTDEEVEAIREQLSAAARFVVTGFVQARRAEADFARLIADLSSVERGEFEERAAIVEFDGGRPRADAEQAAIVQVEQARSYHLRVVPSGPTPAGSMQPRRRMRGRKRA